MSRIKKIFTTLGIAMAFLLGISSVAAVPAYADSYTAAYLAKDYNGGNRIAFTMTSWITSADCNNTGRIKHYAPSEGISSARVANIRGCNAMEITVLSTGEKMSFRCDTNWHNFPAPFNDGSLDIRLYHSYMCF